MELSERYDFLSVKDISTSIQNKSFGGFGPYSCEAFIHYIYSTVPKFWVSTIFFFCKKYKMFEFFFLFSKDAFKLIKRDSTMSKTLQLKTKMLQMLQCYKR